VITVQVRNEDVRDFTSPDPVSYHLNLSSLAAINKEQVAIHRYHLAGWVTVKCRNGRVISKDG
jgi:hypothetical protein